MCISFKNIIIWQASVEERDKIIMKHEPININENIRLFILLQKKILFYIKLNFKWKRGKATITIFIHQRVIHEWNQEKGNDVCWLIIFLSELMPSDNM